MEQAAGRRRAALGHRPAWPVVVSLSSGGVEWAAGMVAYVVAARLGRVDLVRPGFLACAAGEKPLAAAAAADYHALGLGRQAAETWLVVWSQATLLAGLG